MNKQEFISNPDVQKFITFLSKKWDGEFDFKIGIKGKGASPVRYVQISSIRAAYQNYNWSYSIVTSLDTPHSLPLKGNSFEKSSEVLDYCKSKLLVDGQLSKNDSEIREASEIVLKWGGVYSYGNKDCVENKEYDLSSAFVKATNKWKEVNSEINGELNLTDNIDFTSNGGFTKIYSLILEDFVIYDSRVATALAYLIDKCFNGVIPESLNLFIPTSRVADSSKRKVNTFFKSTNQNNAKHFYSSVKTSFILSETLKQINDSSLSLRQIEAALFMIGYDIRNL